MIRWTRALLVSALALSGCNGGPPPKPEPPDLSEPRRLAAEGRALEAVEMYVRRHALLREEPEHLLARAMILHELHKMGAPAVVAAAPEPKRLELTESIPWLADLRGRDLLSAALEWYTRLLATSVDAGQHETCAKAVAEILRLKVSTPAVRRWGGGDAFMEMLYVRLLSEAIADYELFALARVPSKSGDAAAAALDDLAARCHALAELPASLPPAVEHWGGRATRAQAQAVLTRAQPQSVKLDPETRSVVEADVDMQLRNAMEAHEQAVRRRTGNEPPALQLEAYENALRHAVMAIESITRPTPRQADALANARVDFEELKRLAVEQP